MGGVGRAHAVRPYGVLSACAFLLFFGFYLRSLSPAFHPDDSAETITAAFTLSFQHPPGYPLHSMLGNAALRVFPGSPAFGVNALSAFCSALGLLLFAWVLALLAPLFRDEGGPDLWLGILGALVLMCVKELWFQSSIAKGGIYALNFALTQWCLLALLLWRRDLAPGHAAQAFLAFGLGMANHWTSQVVLLPGLGLLAAEAWLAQGRPSLKGLRFTPLAVLPGLSLYIYLPIRAAHHPVLPWGDPSTWKGFWWVFNRSQYAGVESGKTWDSFAALAGRVGANLQFEFHILGLAALAGLWFLMFRKRWMPALGLLLLPLMLTLAVCYKAKPPSDSPWIIDPYLVPLYAGVAVGFAGLALLDARIKFLAPGLALWLLIQHKPLGFQRENYLGYDYVGNLLLSAPKGSLMFCEGDSNTAGPLYHRFVAGKRKDLSPVAVVLSDYEWYRKELAFHNPGLKIPATPLTPPGNIATMRAANSPRPSVITNSYTKGWVDVNMLAPRGLLNLFLDKAVDAKALAKNRIWEAYALRGAFEPLQAMDPLTVRLVQDNYIEALARLAEAWAKFARYSEAEAEYVRAGSLKKGWSAPWVQAGNMAWMRNDKAAAGKDWERAVREDPKSPEALANLGLYHLENGDFEGAMKYGSEALALNHDLVNARQVVDKAREGINHRVAGQAQAETGAQVAARADQLAGENKNEEALREYAKAQRLGFSTANLYRNKAVLLARLNRMADAGKEMEAAVKLEGGSAELWKYLGVFRFHAADYKKALEAMQKAKQLNPKDPELDALIKQTEEKLPK